MIAPPGIAVFISAVAMTVIVMATRNQTPDVRRSAGLLGLLACGVFSFLIVAGWFVGLLR